MKIVMVLNSDLVPGLAANTAAVLGISLGQSAPSIVGPDLYDRSGTLHPGITRQTVPVQAADSETMKDLYTKGNRDGGLEILGFNTIAQKSRDYDAYTEGLAREKTEDLEFSGLCIKGSPSSVNALTGSLKLYR